MKKVKPEKYAGLDISAAAEKLMLNYPVAFARYCNGVGSRIGGFWSRLFYHFIPNTIWFMNITDCSDLHDVDYSVPNVFATLADARQYRLDADLRFYNNLLIRIEERGGWFEHARKHRAIVYYNTLRVMGEDSFMDGKQILNQKEELCGKL